MFNKNFFAGLGRGVLLVIFVMAITGTVMASGNITTTSGNLYLGPAGNAVLPSGDNTVDLGSVSSRWNNIYVSTLVNMTNIQTQGNSFTITALSTNIPYYYLNGLSSDNDLQFLLQSMNNHSATFAWNPGNNGSRTVQLSVWPIGSATSTGRNGLLLWASAGVQAFLPGTDGDYDLGSASYMWKNFYAKNVTVGSATGSGNAYACFNSNGRLYRSATACA